MTIHYMLLHGSSGWGDELIFIGVAIVFIVLMAIQWVIIRTRDAEPDRPPADTIADADEEPDRFRLD